MFGKLMNNFYYGKSGKGDYRKEDLPHTRMQLFWEMLRIRFTGLVKLNLVYMLCWLPAILVLLVNTMAFLTKMVEIIPADVAADASVYAAASVQLQQAFNTVLYPTLILLLPCIALTGPFTAGMTYVVRNWARDEHAFVWSDFKDAMKGNWKQALAISAITGTMPIMLYVCYTFYGNMLAENPVMMLPQMLVLMVGVLWLLALPYFYPLMITYKLKMRELLRDGLLLGVARLPQNVGIRLIQLVPALIALIVMLFQPLWGMLGLVLYYLVFGFTLSRFISVSYITGVFDRYINSKMENVQINRGIYEDPDELEDEDEDSEELT